MEIDIVSLKVSKNLAKKLLGEGYSQVQRGRNNWVFENNGSILTIPRHERVKDYKLRVEATKRLDNYGIPVARILEYSPKNNSTPEYLIVEKLDGEHADLEKRTSAQRDYIHRSSGEILKAIHKIPGNKFGRLNDSLVGKNYSWISFVDHFFSDSMSRVHKVPVLWYEYSTKLFEDYYTLREKMGDLQNPSFLHADYHLNNLLFKDSKVLAVLDLDIVTSGDPSWDTGHYCHTFNIDRNAGTKSFRKGYGGVNEEMERIYCLAIWARKIGSQGQNRKDALQETIPELNRILKNG
jgi:aminoglycoside phosphotransferase (APT) family kinase protein